MVKATGKRKDGYVLDYSINVVDYINSVNSGTGGFLQKIDEVKDYTDQAMKGITDPKSKQILGDFLVPGERSAKRKMGDDRQRAIYGQVVDEEKVMDKIREQAQITAKGYLTAGGTANLRALLNSTLKQGTKFYDGVFKDKDEPTQLRILTDVLAENTFSTMTRDMEYSYENGKKIFYSGPGLQAFNEKIEKPKAVKTIKDDANVGQRTFSKDKMAFYYNKVKDMYKTKNPDTHFSINIPGPNGGAGKDYEFYYDAKVGGVVTDKDNTSPISLKAFTKWMKENNARTKKPSLY
jgi:hypothetical protein